MKIAYSFGILDLLHYGHINALAEAKKDSDIHIFGLVSDDAIIEWNGTIISSIEERKKVLKSIIYVDEIIIQDTFDPCNNLKMIHKKYPNAEITLCHGNDWKILPTEEFLKSINCKIKLTEYYERLSPENILNQINARNKSIPKFNNIISTKANTLLSLKNKLKHSRIEDILIISEEQFNSNSNDILKEINKRFNSKKIVVRSSSSNEDGYIKSNAGLFDSFLNVDSSNNYEIEKAINSVIESYKKTLTNYSNEQILIQHQTEGIDVSGVIFTRDLQQNRPYYLINYEDNGSTDSVTSGRGGRSIWISHDRNDDAIPDKWKKLIDSIKEIESILEGMILDIEFAITKSGDVVIFQVRPLAANYRFRQEINDDILFEIRKEEKLKYKKLIGEYNNSNMMFSDMAFWNPSEIIGSNPKNLDYSLYREIITRTSWNSGLVPMGYKKVDNDLMYKFGNKPYISLEHSFMSLIPQQLNPDLTLKLLNYYKNKLQNNLSAHDKIEFEIVFSCFDFETEDKTKELLDYGFSFSEIQQIREILREMTFLSISKYFSVLNDDTTSLSTLDSSRKNTEKKLADNTLNTRDLIHCFITLLEDIKQYGTSQFSRQARYAFIAKSMCRSLVAKGYIDTQSMEEFMLSIETVATKFKEDFNNYLNGTTSRETFNREYGHLRSGTYDIRTDRYDKMQFELRQSSMTTSLEQSNMNKQVVVLDDKAVSTALDDIGFKINCDHFIQFLKTAFEQREYFKFEFTKSLSLALEVLIMIGKRLNIDRSLLSYIEVSDILASEYYDSDLELQEFLTTIIRQRKLSHKLKSKIVLPEVIINENNFDFIEVMEMRPNFITNKEVIGEVVILENDIKADIADKIVVITRADPGFDWIFLKGIKGLITMYGGVASHMAIRCAEFGLPAAIGCGEKIYNFVSRVNRIKIDCKNGKLLEWM